MVIFSYLAVLRQVGRGAPHSVLWWEEPRTNTNTACLAQATLPHLLCGTSYKTARARCLGDVSSRQHLRGGRPSGDARRHRAARKNTLPRTARASSRGGDARTSRTSLRGMDRRIRRSLYAYLRLATCYLRTSHHRIASPRRRVADTTAGPDQIYQAALLLGVRVRSAERDDAIFRQW